FLSSWEAMIRPTMTLSQCLETFFFNSWFNSCGSPIIAGNAFPLVLCFPGVSFFSLKFHPQNAELATGNLGGRIDRSQIATGRLRRCRGRPSSSVHPICRLNHRSIARSIYHVGACGTPACEGESAETTK